MIAYGHSLEKENANTGKNDIKNLFMESVKCLGDSWDIRRFFILKNKFASFIMQKIKLSTLQ